MGTGLGNHQALRLLMIVQDKLSMVALHLEALLQMPSSSKLNTGIKYSLMLGIIVVVLIVL